MSTPGQPLLWLQPPEGLVPLPLHDDPEQQERVVRSLTELLSHITQQPPEELGGAMTAVADWVRQLQVRMLGSFPAHTPDGPAVATLVVAMPPMPLGDQEPTGEFRSMLASGLQELVKRRVPDVDCRVVELPCGPAAALVQLGEYRLPPEKTGRAEATVVPVHRAQFLVPAPTGSHLVLLEVSTGSEQGWPAAAEEAVRVAHSITFRKPAVTPGQPVS